MQNNFRKFYLLIFGVLLVTIGNTFEFDLEQGFDDPMTKDSAKDGGLGFSKIAKSLGYETNTNIEAGDPRAKKGGTLTMLGGAEYPKTFRDIGKDSRSQINGLMAGIQYESLLAFDYENLEWKPNLATHWKMESDSLTYRFRIDPNARWSDGKDITANDVVAYFKLLIDPGHKDPNVSKIYDDLFEVPEAESKYIVKVKSKKKDWRTFRYAAGFTPLPSYYLDKTNGAGYIEKYNYSFMPVSGPYQYDKKNSKSGSDGYIIFNRRKDYWAKDYKRNKGYYNFDKIKFIFIEDENQQVVSYLNGDYDIYPWSRAQWWVERFNDEKTYEIEMGWVQKIKVFNSLPKGPSGIVFNTRKIPWKGEQGDESDQGYKVRKAFAHLFDVEKLNKRLFFNEYTQLNTFFFGTPYANPRNQYTKYDPKEALNLLNQAGWEMKDGDTYLNNKKGEIFKIQFLIGTGEDRIYSAFQQDLKKVGILMEFDQMDANGAFSKTMKKEFEVTSQGWTGGFFPSPEGMMHGDYADDIEVTNITSMNIPELNKLIDEYNMEWDAKKRIPIAHKIDSIAVNSYHYAMGWTSPYGARMLYWNKFGIPEKGVSFVGDWRSPISMWWVDDKKERTLSNARKNKIKLPKEQELYDYWDLMPK